MAGGNMKLLLTLEAKEAGVARALKQMQDNIRRTAVTAVQESEKAGRAQEGVVRRIERETRQASAARARLGIRSEREIQREIMRTQQAYTALARGGKASQNELARAALASKQRIRELNEELGRSSKLQKAMQIGGAALAGITAAGAVLKPAMNDQKQLQANISQVAFQAFGEDESKDSDWIASEGKKQIKELVIKMVRDDGGNADAALNLVNSMMANGMSFDQVKDSSQTSYRAMLSSAESPGEYNPEGTAKLMKILSESFKGKDLAIAFEHVMKSAMQGNFEIPDMIRELPALLPASKMAGMNNVHGLDYLLSMLQSASNKSGSNSEAANNVRNVLEKALSPDTTRRLAGVIHPTKPGKGIDWQGSVIKGLGKGENAVEVLARVADKILVTDKEYQGLKVKADKGDLVAANQMNTMKGFVLSQLMTDLQAKSGLNAAVDTEQMSQYMQGLAGLNPENSLVDKKMGVISRDDAFIQEKNNSLALLGRGETTDPLNNLQTQWTALTAEFPNTTLALTALAAAAAAASGAIGLMSLAGVGGKGGAAGLAKGAAAAGGRFLGKGAKLAGRAAPIAAGAIGLYNAYDIEQREDLSREDKNNAQITNAGSTIGGIGGAWGGAALGAAIGSAVPVIGTVIGGAIGAALGAWAGSAGGEAAAGLITRSKAQYPAQRSADVTQSMMPPQLLQRPGAQVPALTPEKMQPMFYQQTADFQASVQQGTNQLGTRLDRITGALASQQQTIQNNISVMIDGRVVSEQVSRQQFSMFNRGAAQ